MTSSFDATWKTKIAYENIDHISVRLLFTFLTNYATNTMDKLPITELLIRRLYLNAYVHGFVVVACHIMCFFILLH